MINKIIYKRLRDFSNKNGWKCDKNIAYKDIDGYLFTLVDGQGFKLFVTPLMELRSNRKKKAYIT